MTETNYYCTLFLLELQLKLNYMKIYKLHFYILLPKFKFYLSTNTIIIHVIC